MVVLQEFGLKGFLRTICCLTLPLKHTAFALPFLFPCLSQNFPATYDETLCKFLLYTYKDSHNSFWSKKLSREHVEYLLLLLSNIY